MYPTVTWALNISKTVNVRSLKMSSVSWCNANVPANAVQKCATSIRPKTKSWHKLASRCCNWTNRRLVLLAGPLPTIVWAITVATLASSFWNHSTQRQTDGWWCPTMLWNLWFHPSHTLLVHALPFTVVWCIFHTPLNKKDSAIMQHLGTLF